MKPDSVLYYSDMKYPRAARVTKDLGMLLIAVGSCLIAAVGLRMFNGTLNETLFYPSILVAVAGLLSIAVSPHIAKIKKTRPEAASRPKLTRVK